MVLQINIIAILTLKIIHIVIIADEYCDFAIPYNDIPDFIKSTVHGHKGRLVFSEIQDKTAEWYYLSSIANYYTGNRITALNHAKTAVQMEPNNLRYQELLQQLQDGGNVYREQSRAYGRPFNMDNICFWWCLADTICNCCCGPRFIC